jgi:hypothetical protein
MKSAQAYRTGRLAHLKRDAFAQVFNVPVSAEQPCIFVEPGVIEQQQVTVVYQIHSSTTSLACPARHHLFVVIAICRTGSACAIRWCRC